MSAAPRTAVTPLAAFKGEGMSARTRSRHPWRRNGRRKSSPIPKAAACPV
jgi:hypothetical protein